MKISEFIRSLKKKGAKFHSHGTRHDWYVNPSNGKRAQIPRHKSKELAIGTMRDILRALELD